MGSVHLPAAMRSLRSFSRDEVIRLEGKVEAALEALARLEAVWRALDEHDLLALAQVVVPEVEVFDRLDCSERETFLEIQARIEDRLGELEVPAGTTTLRLRALLERPIIHFPGDSLLRRFDRTGDWLWYGHTAFHLKRVVVKRVSGETCKVETTTVSTAELRRLGVEVPPVVPVAPRPPRRPPKQLPEPLPQSPTTPPTPLVRDVTPIELRGKGWATAFVLALVVGVCGLLVIECGGTKPSSREGESLLEGLPEPPEKPRLLHRLPDPSARPLLPVNPQWEVARVEFARREFEELLPTSAPEVVSVTRFPAGQPLRARWGLTDADRPKLVVVDFFVSRYLLEHPGAAQFELQLDGMAPPIFLDAIAHDPKGRELALGDRESQTQFVVALLFLAEQPPSGTARLRAWNGLPSASVPVRPSESTVQLAPTRPPSPASDLFRLLDERPPR